MNDAQIKLELLESVDHLWDRNKVNIKAEHDQRMDEGAAVFNFAALHGIDGVIGKQDSVTVDDWIEVDAQAAGRRKGFVPGRHFGLTVSLELGRLLHKGERLVPRLCIFHLHRTYQIFECLIGNANQIVGEGVKSRNETNRIFARLTWQI